jgi:mono/diheme cytochrome c family protein
MSKAKMIACCLLLCAGCLAGCRQDMHNNPKYKTYRDGGMREYPAGVVARGSLQVNPVYPTSKQGQVVRPQTAAAPAGASAQAGAAAQPGVAAPMIIPVGEDAFPFKVTKEMLDRGQERFNISCVPCHGRLGDGKGMIVLRGFKTPPTYHQERLRLAPASHFYDVMTNGFGAMPSYADQLTQEDRWKVAAYIRVLQLSQHADFNALPDADKAKVREAAAQKPAETQAK